MEREAHLELVAMRHHPKPHRATRHANGLLSIREDQLRVHLGGDRKPRGTEAAQAIGGELFRERLKDPWGWGLAQADGTIGSHARRATTFLPDHS